LFHAEGFFCFAFVGKKGDCLSDIGIKEEHVDVNKLSFEDALRAL